MSSIFGRFVALVVVPMFLLLGSCLGQLSFDEIQDMRDLERVPPTRAVAVLPGEVNLTGKIEFGEKTLTSPDRKRPCVYYRYLIEREERDSDGDTRWVTERDETRYTSFFIRDDSGHVWTRPTRGVSWDVEQDWSTRRGDRRYTEWRLDENERIFCFGFARRKGDKLEISFDVKGRYSPILSQGSEAGQRQYMATVSVFLCWGALVMLSFAIVFVCYAGKIHRLFVYLILVSATLGFGLFFFGVTMIGDDLESAAKRLERHRATAADEIARTLGEVPEAPQWQSWAKLSDFNRDMYNPLGAKRRARVKRLRLDLVRAIDRTNQVRARFPENVMAPMFGVAYAEEIPIPESAAEAAEALDSNFQPAAVSGWIALILGLIASFLGVLLTRWGFRTSRHKRLIENIPTTPTAGASYGPLEVAGKIEIPNPMKGPLSRKPCAQYHYVVKEKRGSGKNSSWHTIEDTDKRRRFHCVDREGRLLIDPSGAEIFTKHKSTKREGRRVSV